MQMSRSIKRKRAKLASARAKPHTESTHKVNPNAKIQHGKLSDQPDVDALRLDLKKPAPVRKREIWEEHRVTHCQLPELIEPEGAGYMPLFCAAQWILTRGGTREIDPLDEVLWREAFQELLDRIASQRGCEGRGMRDGVTANISGLHFASCSVDYPFSEARLDLILSEELCLVSRPYIDDEHWRGGFDDSLEDRGGARWRRLMVLKADVARYWPFAAALYHRTGAPGRPVPCILWKRNIVRVGNVAMRMAELALKRNTYLNGSRTLIRRCHE